MSLEAHGQYISSLIEPEETAAYLGTDPDALLAGLPPVELAMGATVKDLHSPQPHLGRANCLQEWRQGSTWEMGHSSGTPGGRMPPQLFSRVRFGLLSFSSDLRL